MRTILVLAASPDLANAIRAAVSAETFRVIDRTGADEAEPLLTHDLADLCVLDLDVTSVQAIWVIEKLRRRAPQCPLIIFSGTLHPEWEEEAYLRGVKHVLAKPVRARLLNTLLDRLWTPGPGAVSQPSPEPEPAASVPTATPEGRSQPLSVLRDFSSVLTHSLNAEAMLNQFLLLLREILGINRATIFLRAPIGTFPADADLVESRRLRAVCTVGLPPELLQHFELSFDSGIGRHLFRFGRILRRESEEARIDIETRKEFELLGGQVAVPVLDRETVLGVAVFDRRVTGEALSNSELELTFHLLEQLGLGIRNIWLHDQLAANHQMMAGILRELSSACIVVGRDLTILHANKTARKYFGGRGAEFTFSDLPASLATQIYQVLKTGSAVSGCRFEPAERSGVAYQVNIIPFQREPNGSPASALLTADDLSQAEQLRHLEVEAANLRLVKNMADRLTHEIGNALVPLSTHQQLLKDKWKDPEFRASLDSALTEGVRRINRLTSQMRFLARDTLASLQRFPLAPVIEEAYAEATEYQSAKSGQLRYEKSAQQVLVNGDRAALKYALVEVMLNALQANPTEPKIGVRLHMNANGNGHQAVEIEVQDNGSGFTAEIAQKAFAPFCTTRNVGLGLGLTVSRKIVETHHGKIEIVPGKSGLIRISLPLEASLAA